MLELLIASCEPLANSLKLCRGEIKVPGVWSGQK
jgi:hypothetical protein